MIGKGVAGLALLALLALPATARAETAVQTAAANEVRAMIGKVAEAYAANDYETYFSFFDDDIMIWNGPNARWVKQDYVTRWSKAINDGGGVSSLAVEDLQLRVSPAGDSVIATFAMPVISRKNGEPAAAEPTVIYHMSEAWFKRDGRWSMSHMHWSARVPAKP